MPWPYNMADIQKNSPGARPLSGPPALHIETTPETLTLFFTGDLELPGIGPLWQSRHGRGNPGRE